MPAANSAAPTAGPTSWFVVSKPAISRALPMPRSGLGHDHRQQRAGGRVGEHLGGAEQEHRDQDDGDAHLAGDHRGGEDGEHGGAQQVDRDHEAPAVEPVGEHAGVEPEQQPRQAAGAAPPSATSSGSWVCEAISSGPAASPMPSPRLLIHDEPTSQRNAVPMRAGSTVSINRAKRTPRQYGGVARGARPHGADQRSGPAIGDLSR